MFLALRVADQNFIYPCEDFWPKLWMHLSFPSFVLQDSVTHFPVIKVHKNETHSEIFSLFITPT
jgi:hypothetical protein